MFQLDNERRTLKKKRKRLRQLRDEVRELSSHVHSKRVYQGVSNDLFCKYF